MREESKSKFETGPTLSALFQRTKEIFDRPGAVAPGIDWLKEILPKLTEGCRASLRACEAQQAYQNWEAWLREERTVAALRDAGDEAFMTQRLRNLSLMLGATAILAKESNREMATTFLENARLGSDDHACPNPKAFVQWLLEDDREPVCRSYVRFPMVLSKPRIVSGMVLNALLVQWEVSAYEASDETTIDWEPETYLTRCLVSAEFREAVSRAKALTLAGRKEGASPLLIRIAIQAVEPQFESVLLDAILKGPSAGGALAIALQFAFKRLSVDDRTVAVSVALGPSGGKVQAVTQIQSKVDACSFAGVTKLIVAGSLLNVDLLRYARQKSSIELVGITSIEEALAAFSFPQDPKREAPFEPKTLSRRVLVGSLLAGAVGGSFFLARRDLWRDREVEAWRDREVSIALVSKGILTYVREISSAFREKLGKELHRARVEPFDLVGRSVSEILTVHNRRPFDFFVTIGTQPTKELSEGLGRTYGEVPFLFLGVSFPVEGGYVRELRNRQDWRRVTGVKYGPGPHEIVRILQSTLPNEERFVYLYDPKVEQDSRFVAELKKLPQHKSGLIKIRELADRLTLEEMPDPDAVYFGWYALEEVFDSNDLDICAKRKVVASTKRNAEDPNRSFLAIAPEDALIGSMGADLVCDYLRGKSDLGKRDVLIPPYHYWVNVESAKKHGIVFSSSVLRGAKDVFPR